MKKRNSTVIYDLILAILTGFAIIAHFINSSNLVNTLSYFTILSNLIIAISLTIGLVASQSKIGRFFAKSSVQSALTTYIIIVSLIYNFILRSSRAQPIIELIYDNLLHVVTPVMFLIRWIIYIPKGELRWTHGLKWLSFPLAYFIYSLIRGKIVNWYPYPFVDLRKINTSELFRNALIVLFLFFAVGQVLILADRMVRKKRLKNKS